VDAHDLGISLAREVTGSHKADLVVSSWGDGWHVPRDGSGELISDRGGLWVVLIIQWGTVPVNVDMDVLKSARVSEDTGQVEGDVAVLHKRSWVVVGVVGVEGELADVVVALLINHIS